MIRVIQIFFYITCKKKFKYIQSLKLKVCHDDIDEKFLDAGGPTYWRLARLQTQMTRDNKNTKDGGTRATTQEPQGN